MQLQEKSLEKNRVLKNLKTMSNIDSIVKKTLLETYETKETFRRIVENVDGTEEDKFNDAVDALVDLEKMGKSDEEIEGSLDEGITDWLSKYIAPGGDGSSDSSGNKFDKGNVTDKLGSGVMSQVREYIIRKLLGMVGFKGALRDAVAASLADLKLGDVVVIFKGQDSCVKHGDKLADAFMEGLFVYVSGGAEKNSAASNFLRQVGGEYLRGSDIGEKLAASICTMNLRSKLKT
jgi:hypothetical protein